MAKCDSQANLSGKMIKLISWHNLKDYPSIFVVCITMWLLNVPFKIKEEVLAIVEKVMEKKDHSAKKFNVKGW